MCYTISIEAIEFFDEDDARYGRPNEAVTEEDIKRVHKIIFDGPKLKLSEIADTLMISCWSYRA